MIRLAVQRALERGVVPNAATTLLSRAWADRARVARPLVSRRPVLCVSGSTLGGSGKTPLAIACARFLARSGLSVALVGHAYGAKPPRDARRVVPNDDARIVGDEAIECARALADDDVTVLVARSRQAAIDAASESADVLVLDGPLQLAPRRATLALLAVDPHAPWGSGACPPLGNLRAPKEALLEAADLVVPVAPTSRGVWKDDELIHMDELRRLRIGLTTGIARPHRVVAMLRAQGIHPDPILYSADHSPIRMTRTNVDLWVTTAKDSARAEHCEPSWRSHGADTLGVLDYYLDLPSSVTRKLRSRFSLHF